MSIKLYQKLRLRMTEIGVDQKMLAQASGFSTAHVSQILSGKADLRIDTAWAWMELLEIDPAQMAEYFPKGGVSKSSGRSRATLEDRIRRIRGEDTLCASE